MGWPKLQRLWSQRLCEFGELKVLGYDTKSDMSSKYGTIFLLLYVITNEKSLKLTQIDGLLAASKIFPHKNTFQQHSCMGTARMKLYKETDEVCKKRGVSMERSKAVTKEVLTAYTA